MRKRLFLIGLATVAAITCLNAENKNEDTPVKANIISSGIKFSEGSVVYDNSLLVSNFGTAELNPMNTEGKGYISKINGDRSEIFISTDGNLNAPKGMAVSGNYLLIADVGKVVVYNLNKKSDAPQIIQMPEGNLFVNDIAIAGKYAYISVTNTGKIFKLNRTNLSHVSSSDLSEYASVTGANGLVIDGNKMYITSYPADGKTTADNVIYIIEKMDTPAPQKLITREGQYDGIACSSGKLYFSSWVNGEIGYVDLKTKAVKLLSIENAKLTGPADISIFQNKLYIPNLPASEIVVIPL